MQDSGGNGGESDGGSAIDRLVAAGRLHADAEFNEVQRAALNSLTVEEVDALISAADKLQWPGPLPVEPRFFIPF